MSSEVSRRTGLIAQKVGMTQIFDNEGKAMAVTLLKANGNVVLGSKNKGTDGYTSLVVGYGEAKPSRVNKSVKGVCAKAGTPPVKRIREFRISENALMEAGSKLSVEHFVEGQSVDIHGTNIGKGFAGPMKRWNFRGLEATHGVSVSHRSHGSTGQRQDPGKTFRGKKMAGHMGVETVTIQNLRVVRIDSDLGLIAVNGSVPGKKDSYVTITDAVKLALPGYAAFPGALLQSDVKESKEVESTVAVVENEAEQNN